MRKMQQSYLLLLLAINNSTNGIRPGLTHQFNRPCFLHSFAICSHQSMTVIPWFGFSNLNKIINITTFANLRIKYLLAFEWNDQNVLMVDVNTLYYVHVPIHISNAKNFAISYWTEDLTYAYSYIISHYILVVKIMT